MKQIKQVKQVKIFKKRREYGFKTFTPEAFKQVKKCLTLLYKVNKKRSILDLLNSEGINQYDDQSIFDYCVNEGLIVLTKEGSLDEGALIITRRA